MSTTLTPFHIAFPVDDLSAARKFYGAVLGCPEGRSSESWIDFDLFGHQIVAHLSPEQNRRIHNPVDGHDVPVPHFGVVLEWQDSVGLLGVNIYDVVDGLIQRQRNYFDQLSFRHLNGLQN